MDRSGQAHVDAEKVGEIAAAGAPGLERLEGKLAEFARRVGSEEVGSSIDGVDGLSLRAVAGKVRRETGIGGVEAFCPPGEGLVG